MGRVAFHETMRGFAGARELDANPGFTAGRHAQTDLRVDLDITIEEVGSFIADPRHAASASGTVTSPLLGGSRPVLPGSTFNLLVEVDGPRSQRMLYRMYVEDAWGAPVTLSGFKVVHDDPGFDVWADTSVLRTRLLRGHLDPSAEDAAGPEDVLAAGLIHISFPGFLRLVATMRGSAADRARFGLLFLGDLWRVYGGAKGTIQDAFAAPDLAEQETPPAWERLRERGIHAEVHPLRAGDGLPLRLAHFRGDAEPTRGPVLLAAGTGVRGAIFSTAPTERTMVDALVGDGYDVWVADWRASIDFPPRAYTLDQAAVFDHPAAIRAVREHTGAERIKALVHCQGSTSFTMTALAGLAGDVTTVASNAVSLHPVVTIPSRLKLAALVPALSLAFDGLDPQWAINAPSPLRRATGRFIRTVRRDCDEPACVMSNYIYGAGRDVLWRHANLDEATHHWVTREFGYVPMAFFRQILRSVRKGMLQPVDGLAGLPASFADSRPPEGQVWTFLSGDHNRCFLPDGQTRSHAWFRERSDQDHQRVTLPGYSHLDVFFGRRSAQETFPPILAALAREPA